MGVQSNYPNKITKLEHYGNSFATNNSILQQLKQKRRYKISI